MLYIQKAIVLIRKIAWTLILAFMIAWHNVYREEVKAPDFMVIEMEVDSEISDSAPKD